MTTPISIIIADDHKMIIDGLKSMLKGEARYQVIAEAYDGTDALELISREPNKYDILLTDISMPQMTGTELCKHVKADHPHIKVLILSMYNSTSVIKEAITADADAYILKNTGKTEFLTALQRISGDSTYFSEDILPILSKLNPPKEQDAVFAGLSDIEKEVLNLTVKEHTLEEIGQKLSMSEDEVRVHRKQLLEKSNSRSTIGLVRFAIKNGLS